jgi:hypothetical protein
VLLPTLAAAVSLAAAACGSSTVSESSVTTVSAQAPNDGVPLEQSLFPDVSVQNVADGSSVNLQQELQGGDLPVLLWFWAPH